MFGLVCAGFLPVGPGAGCPPLWWVQRGPPLPVAGLHTGGGVRAWRAGWAGRGLRVPRLCPRLWADLRPGRCDLSQPLSSPAGGLPRCGRQCQRRRVSRPGRWAGLLGPLYRRRHLWHPPLSAPRLLPAQPTRSSAANKIVMSMCKTVTERLYPGEGGGAGLLWWVRGGRWIVAETSGGKGPSFESGGLSGWYRNLLLKGRKTGRQTVVKVVTCWLKVVTCLSNRWKLLHVGLLVASCYMLVCQLLVVTCLFNSWKLKHVGLFAVSCYKLV